MLKTINNPKTLALNDAGFRMMKYANSIEPSKSYAFKDS